MFFSANLQKNILHIIFSNYSLILPRSSTTIKQYSNEAMKQGYIFLPLSHDTTTTLYAGQCRSFTDFVLLYLSARFSICDELDC